MSRAINIRFSADMNFSKQDFIGVINQLPEDAILRGFNYSPENNTHWLRVSSKEFKEVPECEIIPAVSVYEDLKLDLSAVLEKKDSTMTTEIVIEKLAKEWNDFKARTGKEPDKFLVGNNVINKFNKSYLKFNAIPLESSNLVSDNYIEARSDFSEITKMTNEAIEKMVSDSIIFGTAIQKWDFTVPNFISQRESNKFIECLEKDKAIFIKDTPTINSKFNYIPPLSVTIPKGYYVDYNNFDPVIPFDDRLQPGDTIKVMQGGPVVATEKNCIHEWKEYIGLTQKYDYCSICDEKRNTNDCTSGVGGLK